MDRLCLNSIRSIYLFIYLESVATLVGLQLGILLLQPPQHWDLQVSVPTPGDLGFLT